MMFYKKRDDILYRDYGDFAYLSDNANFEYNFINRNGAREKIVSQSGAVFLNVLDFVPKNLDAVLQRICGIFQDADVSILKNDVIEFFADLEKDGFLISGNTYEECENNEKALAKSEDISDIEFVSSETEKQSTTEFLKEYFQGEPQLQSVTLEITSLCNERCVHCYIPHNDKIHTVSSEKLFDVLKQIREMNVLNVTITGGEPMLHTDFLNLLKKCREYNFSVNVLSNLTLLTDEIIEEMQKNKMLSVQTSLYAVIPAVHDEITQQTGAFEKTMHGIRKIQESGIPLQVNCPILKDNLKKYKDVIAWGEANGITITSEYTLIGQYDNCLANLRCRLTYDDVAEITKDRVLNDTGYREYLKNQMENPKQFTENDAVCPVCQSAVCISATGNVFPCAGWDSYSLGNIYSDTVSNIWHNAEKVRYLRNLKRKEFPQCKNCTDKEFCKICLMYNANEDSQGNPLHLNPYFCKLAKLTKRIYLEN